LPYRLHDDWRRARAAFLGESVPHRAVTSGGEFARGTPPAGRWRCEGPVDRRAARGGCRTRTSKGRAGGAGAARRVGRRAWPRRTRPGAAARSCDAPTSASSPGRLAGAADGRSRCQVDRPNLARDRLRGQFLPLVLDEARAHSLAPLHGPTPPAKGRTLTKKRAEQIERISQGSVQWGAKGWLRLPFGPCVFSLHPCIFPTAIGTAKDRPFESPAGCTMVVKPRQQNRVMLALASDPRCRPGCPGWGGSP